MLGKWLFNALGRKMSDHIVRHIVVVNELTHVTISERASETAVGDEDKEDENEEETNDVVEKGVDDLEDLVLGGIVANVPSECRLAVRINILRGHMRTPRVLYMA